VRRLTLIAGVHAKAFLVPPSNGRTEHDELVKGVHVNEAQADEKWNFVGKKRGSLSG